jgi:hypothetical protein
MAVDIRCTVSCSLGTVISGSVSDEYVQGTGLVKCTGSVIIADVITPAIGTAVTISYTKGGTTRTIPRKLRVLSSFADPFRATTSVELGCKLTYLQDKRDRINWTAFDDPSNTLTESDAEIITIPITAQSVANKCLYELDITSSLTLSNQFSIPRFDLSAGYVSVLSDLLVSECKCGYLDEDEELQVFSLNPSGGTGPAFDATQLVDISKIGVGQLPGEAVTVSYSTLKLKGEVQQTRPEKWDRQVRTATYEANINYTPPATTTGATRTYNILENDETLTTYTNLTKPDGEVLRLPSQRIRTITSGAPAQVGNLYSEYLTKGISVSYQNITKTTVETYEYDEEGNETRVEKIVNGGLGYLVGSMSVPITFDDGSYVSVDFNSQVNLEREVRETITVGQVQQVTTSTYGSWFKSITGQQAIAAGRVSLTSSAAVSAYIDKVANAGLYLLDTRVETVATVKPVSAPTTAEVNNQAAAKGGNPNSGYRAESTSQLALAVGSATAQRRIEFSLPHAPDDRFYKVGASYGSTASDAPQRAQLYGRVQNRLLLGNRNGMNIQLAPELMPTAPFAPFTITAKGATAQYRTNGTSWAFDASGMVVSTDALFWGGVGGTFASRWFPVAPGITSLPTTPAVVDGQMTVTNVVPVANETVLASGRLRLGIAVTGYSYPLELLTTVSLTVKTKVRVSNGFARVSGTAAPVLGAGQVTPTSTATGDGWTLAYDSTDDEASTLTDSFGFSFTLDGTAYTDCYVVSNQYITFGTDSIVYSGFAAGTPSAPKLLFGSGDFSYQRVYTKAETGLYRIRWEGNSSYSAAAGNSNRFAEVTFYAPLGSGTQLLEVRSGNISGSTSGPLMLATASTSLASDTFAANESWVFEGNSTGTTWTVYATSHVES